MTTPASSIIRKIALAVITILLVSASVADAAKKKKVLRLTRENWPEHTLGKKVLVLFTFKWCHHCKNFKPTWSALRKKYASDELAFLDVDCEDEEGEYLCEDFGVSGLPHLRWGNTAVTFKYQGEFAEEPIEDLIRDVVVPAKLCSVLEPENCPEEDRADMMAIDNLTTEYLKKIHGMSNVKSIRMAQQTVQKHAIENPFWVDASGTHQRHGYQPEETLFTSNRESIKAQVQRMIDSENQEFEDDPDTWKLNAEL